MGLLTKFQQAFICFCGITLYLHIVKHLRRSAFLLRMPLLLLILFSFIELLTSRAIVLNTSELLIFYKAEPKGRFRLAQKALRSKKELLSCNLIGCRKFVAQSAWALSSFLIALWEFKYFELASAALFAWVENSLYAKAQLCKKISNSDVFIEQ